MTDRRDIIEMKAEPDGEGKIFYASSSFAGSGKPQSGFLVKVFGAALGVGIFLLLVFFFVYVVLPVVAILIIWGILRSVFRPRR